MYEQFFGLRERPFDLTPDPRFLVMTEAHAEVLSTLEYAIASRKGVTVLIGEAGLGKTTLLSAALARQPERVHHIQIQNPVLSRAEFVELLARRFGLSKEAAASKTTMLYELETLLKHARHMGETTLLVIDEGQSLPAELLEEVRLLANIETQNDRLLSVIIAGQPELADRLNDPALRQFKQRIALRCRLRPLTADEVTTYLAGRIASAGGVGGQAFTREAVSEIYSQSCGVPRTVSVIADNALLGGYAAGVKPVVASIVREVCRDLDLPEPGTMPAPSANGRAASGAGARSANPEAAFRTLRARVSLPREDEAARAVTGGRPKAAEPRRRRFFFFF
jgi:general secretion pathway protein A